ALITLDWIAAAKPLAFAWRGADYEFLHPEYLALVWLAPVLWVGIRFSLADLPWQQRWLSWLMRAALVSVLALTLARAVTHAYSSSLGVVFVVDVSDSVTDAALEQARSALDSYLADLPTDTDALLVSFAERPHLHEFQRQAETGQWIVPDVASLRHHSNTERDSTEPQTNPPGAATNIQAAMQLAYGVLPPGKLKRLVLFSDGVETRGNLLAEASRARRFGV